MGIPATRFVSELLDDTRRGSTEHDVMLILGDARGPQIKPSSQPYNPLGKNCNADLAIVASLPIHQRWSVAVQGPSGDFTIQ